MIFQDRTGTNLNRKKIKIISQTPTEIIADIERADTPVIEGTTINASVFNGFQNEINLANTNASTALTSANLANTSSLEAKEIASEAKTESVTATSIANDAKATALSAIEKATEVEANFNEIVNSSGQSSNPYPIGAIYMSTDSTSPASLFGGTWEAIENRFLIGASSTYTLGDMGGATSHNHGLATGFAKLLYASVNDSYRIVLKTKDGVTSYTTNIRGGTMNSPTATGNNLTSGTALGGNSENSSVLPPYLAVSMWKRVA